MRYVDQCLYKQESVLIPRKGTLNNVTYVSVPFWSVDTMFYTEMKQENIAKFVFQFLKTKDLASMNTGMAVPSMTREILDKMQVIIPSIKTLEKFENIMRPLYNKNQENIKNNQTLAQLRDTLLPKLMRGEINVSI